MQRTCAIDVATPRSQSKQRERRDIPNSAQAFSACVSKSPKPSSPSRLSVRSRTEAEDRTSGITLSGKQKSLLYVHHIFPIHLRKNRFASHPIICLSDLHTLAGTIDSIPMPSFLRVREVLLLAFFQIARVTSKRLSRSQLS